MGITLGTSGGNETLQAITVGTDAGNKPVIAGWVGTPDGNKQIFAALAVVLVPSTLAPTTGSGNVSSQSTTATPQGGIGPFTYAWRKTGGAGTITPTSSNTATTAFRAFLIDGDVQQSDFVCDVTDTATGAVATSPEIGVTFIGSSGG